MPRMGNERQAAASVKRPSWERAGGGPPLSPVEARHCNSIGFAWVNAASANFEQVRAKEDLSGLPAWALTQAVRPHSE